MKVKHESINSLGMQYQKKKIKVRNDGFYNNFSHAQATKIKGC